MSTRRLGYDRPYQRGVPRDKLDVGRKNQRHVTKSRQRRQVVCGICVGLRRAPRKRAASEVERYGLTNLEMKGRFSSFLMFIKISYTY